MFSGWDPDEGRPTTSRPGSTRAWRAASARAARGGRSAGEQAGHGGQAARSRTAIRPSEIPLSKIRAASSRSSSGTSPLHAGDGREGLRHAGRPSSSGRDAARNSGRERTPRSATRSAGPSTPPASRTSAPRRSSSCCWATWAVPAAASWRCAAMPRSRARPTSRRSTTSSRATSRCRTARPQTWPTYIDRTRPTATGQHTPTWSACSRRGTAMPRPGERLLLRYLPRIDGDHSHLRQLRGMPRGNQRASWRWARTRPSVRPNHACTARRWRKLDGLVVRDLYETETATFWKGLAGDPPGQAEPRRSHRGVLPPAVASPSGRHP